MNIMDRLLGLAHEVPTAGAAAVAIIILLMWLLIASRLKSARFRRSVEEVELRVAEIMERDTVSLADLPGELLQVRQNVETLLSELPEQGGAAGARQQQSEGADRDALRAASALIQATIERLRNASPGSAVNRLDAALRLSVQLQATMAPFADARAQPQAGPALRDRLRSGHLNHVLTTAPLLSVYYAGDPLISPIRLAYQAIAALLEVALAEAGTSVEVVPPLTTMPRNAARVEFGDQRGLAGIPAVRDQVIRAARDVSDTDHLIIDCLAPGWRVGTTERQRPQIVGFSRADWV
jgi:hypothetical protein